MTGRHIAPFALQGKTVYIEVTEVEVSPAPAPPAAAGPGLPSYAEYTSVSDKVRSTGEAIRETIAALAETVQQGLSHLQPDEWKLEVNLGFKGQTGIPFIVGGEANGAVKVTATWKAKQGS